MRSQKCDEAGKEPFKNKEWPVKRLQGRTRKKATVHRIESAKRERMVGIEVREMVWPRLCQAFDVTERSLDVVGQSEMKSLWRILVQVRNKLIYIHF